jgi:hypothetical protein
MLTSTAGELSTDVAKAAPVARARTLDAETDASARVWHTGTFSFPAASRRVPQCRTLPNIFDLLSSAAQGARRRLYLMRKSTLLRCDARQATFTSQHVCVNIVS